MSDQIDWSMAADLFRSYRDKLFKAVPTAEQEAKRLASHVVDCRTASADKIWRVLWDKPLHITRERELAEARVNNIEQQMVDVWKSPNTSGDFSILQKSPSERMTADGIDPDPTGKENDSFVVGRAIEKFQQEHGIGYQYSYAMICAGRRLLILSKASSTPFSYLHGKPLREIVPALEEELGFNWGHTAVLHFLTDLGLACKTDVHVVRAVSALGLKKCKCDQATRMEAIEINDILREFLPLVYSEVTPYNRRHMDKVLMEMSDAEIIPETFRVPRPRPKMQKNTKAKKAKPQS